MEENYINYFSFKNIFSNQTSIIEKKFISIIIIFYNFTLNRNTLSQLLNASGKEIEGWYLKFKDLIVEFIFK